MTALLLATNMLIVGAGPGGLTTAIESHMNGAKVTVIEKRVSYTRPQWVILDNFSVELLEKKWNVHIPEMIVLPAADQTIGVVPIKSLEESLAKRVSELGIKTIRGEVIGFAESKEQALIVESQGTRSFESYDIVVAADGIHSRLRDALGIGCNVFGKSFGMSALMRLPTADQTPEITSPFVVNDMFVRKIVAPGASILIVQTKNGQKSFSLSLEQVAERLGWKTEAKLLKKNKGLVIGPIEIDFQQAKAFSNTTKNALIVGDAAAAASFFEGMGANTAFKAALLVGKFLRDIKDSREKAFSSFEQEIRKTTDELIASNSYLFKK